MEQDIPQDMPKLELEQNKSKKIKSMLLGLE